MATIEVRGKRDVSHCGDLIGALIHQRVAAAPMMADDDNWCGERDPSFARNESFGWKITARIPIDLMLHGGRFYPFLRRRGCFRRREMQSRAGAVELFMKFGQPSTNAVAADYCPWGMGGNQC